MLAVQVDGARVETIEGLTQSGAISVPQKEFGARNALQCGYRTPGIPITRPVAGTHMTLSQSYIHFLCDAKIISADLSQSEKCISLHHGSDLRSANARSMRAQ